MKVESNPDDAIGKLESLCVPLKEILDSELKLGNRVSRVQENGWTKIDLEVSLELPFRKNYEAEINGSGVTFYRNRDSHYPLDDIYTAAAARQAINAPTARVK